MSAVVREENASDSKAYHHAPTHWFFLLLGGVFWLFSLIQFSVDLDASDLFLTIFSFVLILILPLFSFFQSVHRAKHYGTSTLHVVTPPVQLGETEFFLLVVEKGLPLDTRLKVQMVIREKTRWTWSVRWRETFTFSGEMDPAHPQTAMPIEVTLPVLSDSVTGSLQCSMTIWEEAVWPLKEFSYRSRFMNIPVRAGNSQSVESGVSHD